MTIKEFMLASSQIFKTPEKPRPTLTKVLTTLGSPGSTRKKTVTPTVTRIAWPRQNLLPDDIGECISRDAAAVSHLGREEFVWRRRVRGDFTGLGNLRHLTRRLLRQYKFWGAPFVLAGKECTEDQRLAALQRAPHKSALDQIPILRQEFASMFAKGQ